MKEIKFSADYEKLPVNWEGTEAVLIGVKNTTLPFLKNKMPKFLEYDTKYRGHEGNYIIDFDEVLILTFIHINSGMPFTTLRRKTKEKMNYYIGLVSETFKLVRT
jgi:hypothetical protein